MNSDFFEAPRDVTDAGVGVRDELWLDRRDAGVPVGVLAWLSRERAAVKSEARPAALKLWPFVEFGVAASVAVDDERDLAMMLASDFDL